jgi:hypothetical protein
VPGAGTRDESAFTTDMDPRGIQPGTAIVTWLKRPAKATPPTSTMAWYRDFWGPAASKRYGLLASLPSGTPGTPDAAPVYEKITPSHENRWRLAPRVLEGGFEAWPALDELFPVRFQGVNHNRGVDGGIIDPNPSTLAERLKAYFGASSFPAAAAVAPEIASEKARYDPEKAWTALRKDGHFTPESIKPFLAFPLRSATHLLRR